MILKAKNIFKLATTYEHKCCQQQDVVTMVKHPTQYYSYVTDPKNWKQLSTDWETFKDKWKLKPQDNSVVKLNITDLQHLIDVIVGTNKFMVADATGKLNSSSIVYIYISLTAVDNNALTKIDGVNKIVENLERYYAVSSTPIRGADNKVYQTNGMTQVPGKHIEIIDFDM